MSVVHFQGTVTTITSSLDKASIRVERNAKIDLDVIADPTGRYELRPPGETGWNDRELTVSLTTDGRLSSVGGQLTDRSGERLKAIVTLGAAAAGGLVAVGASPLTAALGAVGASAIGAVTLYPSFIEEFDADGTVGTAGEQENGQVGITTLLPARDLGIQAGFKGDRAADHALLYTYRLALLQLTAQHASIAANASMSPKTKAEQLNSLSHVLDRTRAEASLVEARYDAWLRSKEETHTAVFDERLPARVIPDSSALCHAIRCGNTADEPAWWTVATELRTMVSVDYLDDLSVSDGEHLGEIRDGAIVYRAPRPALLTTWKIVDGTTTGLDVEIVRRDRVLVTVPGTETTITVLSDRKAGKVEVGIDPSGALTSFEVSTKGKAAGRAETLSSLPAAAEQALASGKSIGATFNPKQLELDRLDRELKLAETQAKLKGPTDPDPSLKALQDRLALAKLEAQLAAADYITTNPSAATILITQST